MEQIAQLGIKVDSTSIKQATSELSKLTNQSGKTDKGIDTLSAKTSILNAKNAILALATNQVVKEIANLSDNLTNANNKLVLVSKNVNDLTKAQDELYQVSQRTRQGYKETVDLYSNLATSMQDMGKSQSEIIRTVETVNKAIAISGSNAQQSSAAIMQLGQAFGSGQLSGDELNSLKENAQGLAKAIAQGMGVSIGQLKQLGADGKITSEVLAKALEKVADSVDKKFGNMTISLEQGFGTVTNSLSTMTGEFLNATGASTSLANTFIDISKWLDTNKKDIVLYGQTTGAVIGKTIDNFMLLAADIKNVAELLLDSVGIMAFGALEPIAKLLLEVTNGLNDLGLSSDETLSNSQSFYDFANKGLTNFKKSAETNLQDIDNAYKKANVSVEDRIELLKKEWETSVNKKFDGKEEEKVAKKKIELTKAQIKAQEDLLKARSEIAQIGMSSYDKSMASIVEQTNNWIKAGVSENEVLSAKIKLENELKSQNILENLQAELSYYEKKLQLQKDSLDKELELKGIQYTQNVLNIESSDKTIEQKEKLIALETELHDETVKRLKADSNTEFQDTIKSFQEDSFARQIELNNAIFDFGAGFKSSNSEIMEVSKSLAAMSDSSLKSKRAENELNEKYTKSFTQYAGNVEQTKQLEQEYTEDIALLNKQSISNQILGYANLSGAISGMFQQGSKEAATFQAAQTVLALVEGTRAILTAGTGDPYTAIPRMAAMAITVKSLLGNIGVALGIGGTNTTTSTSDSISSQKANTGTGSVLGDDSKASESITQSLAILKDYAKPEFRLTQQMVKSLQSIDNKMGGVSALLVQSGGFGFGAGFTPKASDTGWKGLGVSYQGISNSITNKVEDLFTSVLGDSIGGITGKLFTLPTKIMDKALSSIIGGIFGKSSTTSSTKLTDSGIYFADQLLGSAIDEIFGSMYQTIQKKTTTTKKSWFGSSTSTKKKTTTYFEDMSGFTETERQFSLVLKSIYDSVGLAGEALGESSEKIDSQLNNFVVSIGKVSLKGLSGSQIQSTLTSIFGKIGDQLASSTFPVLVEFQAIGEGLFTTMTRVASGIEQADYYTDRLGKTFEKISYTDIMNKQGDVGFEALYQSIVKTDEALYGVDNNLIQIVKSLTGTAEELYDSYKGLDFLRSSIKFMGVNEKALGFESIKGAGGIEEFSNAINSYFENFLSESEQLSFKSQELAKEFDKLNITMPTTKQGFIDLIKGLDVSTVSGEELYGRLILLNKSFSEIIETADSKVENRSSLIDNLKDFVSSINSSLIKTTTFKDFSTSFNEMIEAIKIGSDDLTSIGSDTIASAQSYLDTVARTAKSSAEIEFAKKVISNKFEGVINAKDITLGTINDTLKISFNEDSVIVKALNDVKNELVYLNQLNTRQTANSNKTLQLQRASIA